MPDFSLCEEPLVKESLTKEPLYKESFFEDPVYEIFVNSADSAAEMIPSKLTSSLFSSFRCVEHESEINEINTKVTLVFVFE